MDDLDQHLIDRLRRNARTPVAELARALGLSRTTIQTRLMNLERRGVIAGYSLRLADDGSVVRAVLMLIPAPRHSAAVVAALERLSGVRSVRAVSGPFELIADIEAPTAPALDVLIEQISALDGVERISASVVLATRFER